MLCLTYLDSPLGKMIAGATDDGLCLFDFQYRRSIDIIMKRIEFYTDLKFVQQSHPIFNITNTQINEYFLGTRKVFEIPLNMVGTPFQIKVWQALLQIPYGETRSYEQQAITFGNIKAIRAVAGANGENGLSVIIPCHRVIGKNGSLTGYGGGLERKKWLLEHERKVLGKEQQGKLFA